MTSGCYRTATLSTNPGIGNSCSNITWLVSLVCCSLFIGNSSGTVPKVKPRQRKLTLVRANLTSVTSPPNPSTGGSCVIFYVPFSYFLFIFYLPGAPYRIFLLFLPWLPCHFYLVITTKSVSLAQSMPDS